MKRNLEALKQLKRVVKAAPAERLHMRAVMEKCECGTAYCAAGWAVQDEWFKNNTKIRDAVWVRIYGGGIDFVRIAEVFGLGATDTSKLFGGNLYPGTTPPHAVTKKAVLDNIDRLLEGKIAQWYKVEGGNS